MKKYLNSIGLLLIINSSVFAESMINFQYANYSTSDKVKLNEWTLAFDKNARDFFWPYNAEIDSSVDYGLKYLNTSGQSSSTKITSQHLQSYIGKKWSDFYLKLNLGHHQFKAGSKESRTTYGIQFQTKYEKLITADLSYKTDWAFKGNRSPIMAFEKLVAKDIKTNFVIQPNDQWRMPLRFTRSNLSDTNVKTISDLNVLYGRAYPIWWWIGYNYNHTSNKNPSSKYWSPKKVVSHGPQFEFSKSFSETLSLNLGGNYGFLKENQLPSGESTYFSLSVDYGSRDVQLWSINLSRGDSKQNGSNWSMNEIGLNFSKMF